MKPCDCETIGPCCMPAGALPNGTVCRKTAAPCGGEPGACGAPVADTPALQLLESAAGHMRARAATFDAGGERSIGKTVEVFNALTGHTLTESHGWTFMLILKLVRDQQKPEGHLDSIEDSVAYAALRGEARMAGR